MGETREPPRNRVIGKKEKNPHALVENTAGTLIYRASSATVSLYNLLAISWPAEDKIQESRLYTVSCA